MHSLLKSLIDGFSFIFRETVARASCLLCFPTGMETRLGRRPVSKIFKHIKELLMSKD